MNRSVQRNSAFFFGAAGAAAGAFGSAFVALFLARALWPEAVLAALDWLVPLWLLLLFVCMVGLWPALDYLANRSPTVGALTMTAVALGFESLGIAGIAHGDPTGFIAWFTVVGGLMLLVGASLAHAGGGTDPLTWETLRTPRTRAIESRLNVLVLGLQLLAAAVFAFVLLGGGRWVEAVLVIVGVAATLWGLLRRPRGRPPAAHPGAERQPRRARKR